MLFSWICAKCATRELYSSLIPMQVLKLIEKRMKLFCRSRCTCTYYIVIVTYNFEGGEGGGNDA